VTNVSTEGLRAHGQEISRNLTVLLADNDPAARHVLRRVLLREFKSVVIEADNGIAALEGLDSGGVDAMVLDLKIPTLGGLDVLRDVRQSPRLRALPVVIVTELKEEASVREAISLGVADYVLKDQHQAVIVERLRRVFSSGGHRGPIRSQNSGARRSGPLSTSYTILVVDEDADFRHFCSEVFRSKYDVTTTASAAQAMALSMTQPPNAILIGSAIGTMSQATFIRRLRQMEDLNDTRLIGVVAKAHAQEAMDAGLYDRVVVRSFVPETFLNQFEQMVRPPGVLGKVVAAVPGFRAQTISAVEQVFGMMLGTEVNILDQAAAGHGGLSVAVPVALAEQISELLVGANVADGVGLELAARMLQSAPGELDAAAATSALAEILNMVGGRVQNALTNQGLRATLGLPDENAKHQPDSEAIVMGFGFDSLGGQTQSFEVWISERAVSAEAAAERQ
jgi:two-component system chemotaxis response regulator CheY